MSPFLIPASWMWRPSPNHSPRQAPVTAIVLHADAAAKISSSLDWVRRAESKVSYHVMVGRQGEVYAVVNPDRKAWHAGVSEFGGEKDWNRHSIGVCLSNTNTGEVFGAVQLASAHDVCAILCGHYGIPVDRIVTHAMVAPTRKTDPLGLDLPAFRAAVSARLGVV